MFIALSAFLAAVLFSLEVNYRDMTAPPPPDPFRLDRFRDGG